MGITAALTCSDSFREVFTAPSLSLSRKRTVFAAGGFPHLMASALQPQGARPSKKIMRMGEGEPVEIISLDT